MIAVKNAKTVMPMAATNKKYRVRLRKVYRNEHTEKLTGSLPIKTIETTAPNPDIAERNARFRFGPDGPQRVWVGIGYGEQMKVELLSIEEI